MKRVVKRINHKHQTQNEIAIAVDEFCTIITTLTEDYLSCQQIRSRFTHEGKRYLTTVLPALGKLVDRSLEIGLISAMQLRYTPTDREGYPTLFNGLWRQLYVSHKGTLYVNIADESRLKILRQLLFYFYKVKEEFSKEDNEVYSKKYTLFERTELNIPSIAHGSITDRAALNTARNIIHGLLAPIDLSNCCSSVISYQYRSKTTHGNGAVADEASTGFRINRRHCLNLTKVNLGYLHNVIPFTPHMKIWDEFCTGMRFTSYTPFAKLCLVPKDSRGPRIICKENSTNMLLQQYYMDILYSHLPEVSGIQFRDQTVNARLAYKASMDKQLATLDLKDASDRVTTWHIRNLFPKDWQDVLLSTRAGYLVTAEHKKVFLRKFAAMGSALCFPIEAMVFYAIAKTVTPKVNVYGDDLIVPNECALDVIKRLEAFGFRVNKEKSLYRGLFRESCGAFYYNGHDIRAVYRRKWSSSIEHLNELISEYGAPLGEHLYNLLCGYGIVYPRGFNQAVYNPMMRVVSEYTDSPHTSTELLKLPLNLIDFVHFPWRFNSNLQKWERRIKTPITTLDVTEHVSDIARYGEWLRLYSGREDAKFTDEPQQLKAVATSRDIKISQQREAVTQLRWR